MTKTITVSFIILGFLISCNDCTKEEDLLLRESALIQRENSFAEKETEYLSLLKFKDSIQSTMDSLAYQIWPDSIAGRWNSKTLCIESNCSDYVIGDQRVDIWVFDQDSTGLHARVLNNKNEIIRTYQANYSPNGIRLTFKTDSLSTRQAVMNVNLDQINSDKISGKRTITIDDKCTAVFNLELSRLNPKN
ncbi:hypothetical protein [Moheibacter sp.]|uniref:hypothetical protein n=1 Tax=Moheibacter sp. TaxID=1965316 RepID=UPI003C74A30F